MKVVCDDHRVKGRIQSQRFMYYIACVAIISYFNAAFVFFGAIKTLCRTLSLILHYNAFVIARCIECIADCVLSSLPHLRPVENELPSHQSSTIPYKYSYPSDIFILDFQEKNLNWTGI